MAQAQAQVHGGPAGAVVIRGNGIVVRVDRSFGLVSVSGESGGRRFAFGLTADQGEILANALRKVRVGSGARRTD